MFSKKPRQYSDEIQALKSIEERSEALDKVPEHLRQLVKHQVEIIFERRRALSNPKTGTGVSD